MLKNARIAVRLSLGFGTIILLLIVMSIFTRIKMGSLADLTTMLYEHPFTVTSNLTCAEADIVRMQRGIKDVLLAGDGAELKQKIKSIDDAEKEAYEHLEVVAKHYLGDKKEVEAVRLELDTWKPMRQKAIALMESNMREEAVAFHKEKASLQIARIEEQMAAIDAFAAKKAASFVEGAKETARTTYTFLYVMVLTIAAVSLAIAFLTSRSITRPLGGTVEAANRIAVGDLEITLPAIERQDEVGELIQAFTGMMQYLREMASVSSRIAGGDLAVTAKPFSDRDILGNAFADMTGYLREMASVSRQVAGGDLAVTVKPVSDRDILGNAFADMVVNLRKINQEIGNGVGVLAASAGEILASTTQIASGMAETATSVSETTATVEEVKQTAQLSAEKSRSVSESAQTAALIAEQGNGAVTETIEGIEHISELMETVAESVVMLSEQTQAIGDIITVVGDLAQQSNLLAVNAAIEASKAGEQGKGFTVVAQEIKSLADQSKQATEQVRTILSDIQKATGKSVLAAEQVSKAVEGGVRQAAESGESIGKLAETIGESARASAQIAASSQQQLAGMEQVAMAMESIKQATQQNVAGTKQAEQAAHALNELGRKLKELVAKFKV